MLSSRTFRLGVAGLFLVVLVACAWLAWQAWHVNRDLGDAIEHAERFEVALAAGDEVAVDREVEQLQQASASAARRTSGISWSVLGTLPIVGDDARGVAIASEVIADLATDGLEPFIEVSENLEELRPRNGTLPVDRIEALEAPVRQAKAAVVSAEERLDDEDPAGFVSRLAGQYRELQQTVHKASAAMQSAEIAVEVLPEMLGKEEPRDYLLLFQNNAEIRATGGMPGSWAQIHADGGRIEMVQQGEAGDFPHTEDPVVELTDAEEALYGEEIGTYFQDPGFAPDFPRAAEIWRAHWDRKFPQTPIDGVIALDPVGMSYLIEGTGPIEVGSTTLTEDNLVEELLNRPYLELGIDAQDVLFQEAAREIFSAMTGDIQSPVALVEGLRRAAGEGRLLVAPFHEADAAALEGTEVLGDFPSEATGTPYVDIGLTDATGSKMSYYLRYWAEIEATACRDGAQQLHGTMTLSQTISPNRAAELPDSVTGGGDYGTEPGTQLVAVRIYGPVGGDIESVQIDGSEVTIEEIVVEGRPATTLALHVDTRDDVRVNWTMRAGEGQTRDIELRMTPGILPGENEATFPSAC